MSRKVAVNRRRQAVQKLKCESYMQMKLKDFLELAPQFKEVLPDELDFDDDNYIVKMTKDFSHIEIGYAEDEWFMKG